MSIPIQNANAVLLSANSGTLPDMGDALLNYFQPMTFTQIVKSVVNYQDVETPTNTQFLGVWQPFSAQKLMMKPEGERKWKWFTVHTQIQLPLEPDDVVYYLTVQYRVMEKFDYSLYNFYEYHLANDYTGIGPNP